MDAPSIMTICEQQQNASRDDWMPLKKKGAPPLLSWKEAPIWCVMEIVEIDGAMTTLGVILRDFPPQFT